MSKPNNESNANKHTESKREGDKPPGDWRKAIGNSFQSLHHGSWIPNLVVGIAIFLIGPAIAFVMNSKQGIVYGAAAGVTILVWVFAVALARELKKTPSESPAATGQAQTEWAPPKIPSSQSKVIVSMGGLKSTFDIALLVHKKIQFPVTFQHGKDREIVISLRKTLSDDIDTIIPVFLTIADDRLYLECTIPFRDKRITIRGNAPQSEIPSGWDWNHNDVALEVVDEAGHPVFQSIYERPEQVVLCAHFIDKDMSIQVGKGPLMKVGVYDPYFIRPLFKYPSWRYKGVLTEDTGKTVVINDPIRRRG